MRHLLTAGRILYRSLEIFLLLIALWFLLAFILPAFEVNSDFTPAQKGIKIFIHSNGVHTDFVVPVHTDVISWDTVVNPANFGADSTYTHVSFGWGNKKFYIETPTWNDLTFSTAVIAAFGLGDAAMHVTYYKSPPRESERTIAYVISEEQYRNLISHIIVTFRHDESGAMLIDHPGYGYHDRFYEAHGHYSFIKTCNEWTGDGMEATGLPVGIWTPMEPSIMRAK